MNQSSHRRRHPSPPSGADRHGRSAVLAGAAAVACLALSPDRAAAQAAKPNVLVFVLDDVGFADLGPYGSEINTPNINALASGGLQFDNYYVHPRCSPSRTALMTGQQNQAVGYPVLAGDGVTLSQNNVFLSELLKTKGYDTYASGKWHLGDTNNFGSDPRTAAQRANDFTPAGSSTKENPLVRGFDGAYTYYQNSDNEDPWNPNKYRLFNTATNPVTGTAYTTNAVTASTTNPNDYTQGTTFNQTDAITDYAIKFMNRTMDANAANHTTTPFFDYVAYGAAHFPLGAPKALVDKYYSSYLATGWDNLRADRLQAMIAAGVVPAGTVLSPRSDVPYDATYSPVATHQIPAWNTLPADRQADLARRMAVYAAMIDLTDQDIGKVISDLKAHGQYDNTLIMLTSDNGANYVYNEFGKTSSEPIRTGAALDAMGTNADTGGDVYLGSGWANAGNTPYQLYKRFTYQGGVKSPFIVDWNDGLAASLKGTKTDQATQINDLYSTVRDIVGASQPTTFKAENGTTYAVKPEDPTNTSMAKYLETGTAVGARDMAWEHMGNRAYLSGDWKMDYNNFTTTGDPGDSPQIVANTWYLYNIKSDPTESTDVSDQNPRLWNQLRSRWFHWAARNNVGAGLPATPARAIAADASTLFLDHFGRADNDSLSADSAGRSGSIAASTPWVEAYQGGTGSAAHSDSIGISNTQLRLANGVGMSNAFLDHNFTDPAILAAGTLRVAMTVAQVNSSSDPSDPTNRFAGFGLGLTRAQALGAGSLTDNTFTYRGNVNGSGSPGVADFFVDLDMNGTLRVWDDGKVVASSDTSLAEGEIEVDFGITSFAAGATVPYQVYLDGQLVSGLSGSFTWDQANSDYFGVSARASNYALMDNLQISAGVPEPASLSALAAVAAVTLTGRRRRGRRLP